jgi:hypothetical protein
MADRDRPFDPYALLAALERRRVAFVVIGAFARVIQGAEEVTDGLDIVPQLRPENLERLASALDDLDARVPGRGDPELNEGALVGEPMAIETPHGELKLIGEPAGTRRGYDDLRRATTREPIGRGLRPQVASVDDLARMLAALDRAHDQARLQAMRRIAELDRSVGLER